MFPMIFKTETITLEQLENEYIRHQIAHICGDGHIIGFEIEG